MSNYTASQLRDTQTLIRIYNRNKIFRDTFISLIQTNRATFQGRPLKFYLKVVADLTPYLFSTYQRSYKKIAEGLGIKGQDLFQRFYENNKFYSTLEEELSNNKRQISPELTELDQIKNETQKEAAFSNLLDRQRVEIQITAVPKSSGSGSPQRSTQVEETAKATIKSEQPKQSIIQPRTEIDAEEISSVLKAPVDVNAHLATPAPATFPLKRGPSNLLPILNKLHRSVSPLLIPTLKNISSFTQIQLKRLTARYLTLENLGRLFSSGVGAVVGYGMGAPSGSGLAGATAGALIGGMGIPNLAPQILKIGGGVGGGAISAGRGVRTLTNAIPQARAVRLAVASRSYLLYIGIAVAAVVVLFSTQFLQRNAMVFNSSIAEGSALEAPQTPGGGGAEISQCIFYRSGDRTSSNPSGGLTFRIPGWPALINEVASKVGIPPSVLAGLLRVECGDCFGTTDPSYIRNDYDSHYSTVNGQPFAYGVMQFYPPTFENTFNLNRDEIGRLFGKTAVKTTVDPQSNMAPPNILRIYSIKDSLIAAAFKSRRASGGNYDRAGIERIVRDYFTQCEYTSTGSSQTFNYCDDLWNSYQRCQIPTPTPQPTLPPGANYQALIKQQFNIEFQGPRFTDNELTWAWEALTKAQSRAPKFFSPLLTNSVAAKSQKYILITHSPQGTETFNWDNPIKINIRDQLSGPFSSKELFQQVLIHELAHVIHGPSGAPREARFDSGISSARSSEGALTAYSQDSIDEAFSEVLSYYIMNNLPEQPTKYLSTQLFWPSINPLDAQRGGHLIYQQHRSFIESLLR